MWTEIHVEQEIYTISSELIDDKWKIMLTDLIELWIEVISREEIIDKCQRLNPLLSIEDVDIDEIITGILNNIPQLAVEVTTKNIKLETTVEGGVFKYEIDLKTSSPQQLWQEVTMPLCLSVAELRRQKEILIKEIKRKDEEILEYRSNGAELIRRHIETKPFSEDAIKGEVPVDGLKCCIDIFKSVINTSEICGAKDKFIKKEPLFNNHRQPTVVPKQPPNEENYIDNTDDSKKRKIDLDTKTMPEPEVEVQDVAMSGFHFMDLPNDVNVSTPSAKRKRGRCSFCPRSCDLKTTATCSKCPSFVCSNHKRVFCIKCVSVPSTVS